ncbi:MAG: calcineurin-like phosphoesterase C-terminal domain-containing protein [Bacteroidales bacterium]|nr:calcineurin-like phosphoesterase C-terminal domain-containing protein [Bacteroidales bacterium]
MKKFIAMALLLVVCSYAHARKVGGTVACGKQKLSGVMVSDGYGFATTDRYGRWSLEVSDDARFVFVITPGGYTADYSTGTPMFWQPLTDASRYTFDLIRTKDTGDYTLFAIADPQCRTEGHFGQFSAEPLQDIKEQAARYMEEGNVFGLLLGDIAWDTGEVINPLYKAAMPEVGIPVYPVVGNHDFDKENRLQFNYEKDFGPLNYAFWAGNDLVVVLRNIFFNRKKLSVEYSDVELDWLRGLLQRIPEDTHIYVAQHAPTWRLYSKSWIGRGEEFLDILSGRNVDILSGHTHIQNNFRYSETVYEHNIAAICGSWWTVDWCGDATPRGYEIFRRRGESLEWHYHPVDYDDDFQFEVILPGHSILNPGMLIVNAWDCDDAWTFEWSENGKPMGEMQQVQDVSMTYVDKINAALRDVNIRPYQRPKKNVHYYGCTPSGKARKVSVTVRTRFGKEYTKEFVLE